MTTDTVCGMNVGERAPFQSELQEQKFFFCSEGCKEEFDRHPERYMKDAGNTPMQGHGNHSGHGKHGCC